MDWRIRLLNSQPLNGGVAYVLYLCQMNRRVEWNHALAWAADLANRHGLPLLVYEGLTCSYPYANDRLHTFILEGVPEMARGLRELGAGYVFYLRRTRQDPDDVLYCLAGSAAAIVIDDYPAFVTAAHNRSVPGKVRAPYYAVDSSCVVPMSRFEKREYAARTIRPKIHRLLAEHLHPAPTLRLERRWKGPVPPLHTAVTHSNIGALASSCEIDHSVRPSISFHGGRRTAKQHLERFLDERLRRYARDRNSPSRHATSDLSPYLHFGRISALETALAAREYARAHKLIADEFLEELIVRRELAFNFARTAARADTLEALPDWARKTLAAHARDARPYLYSRETFERAATHDVLWNAAQKELLLRGKIHGYYRMYWGKKIIEWSATHAEALETMINLNDRYALDGRDPNTYANILWCFGLHDRPWRERPVFGTVRYLSLEGMRRKTEVDAYISEIEHLERTGEDPFRVQ